MNILYLVFGNAQQNHYQAYFSICTFLKELNSGDEIFVLTDSPSFYNRIKGKIIVIEIAKTQLKEWEGEHHFFWRVKIKALEYLVEKYPNNQILYLDTDTFLFTKIEELKNSIKNPIMHCNEGELSNSKNKTEKKMWKQLEGKKIGDITINPNHCMWNAGVVGLPSELALGIVKKALEICDDMLKMKVTPRLIEQFALSTACEYFSKIHSAENIIGHYWGNKSDWNIAIQKIISESFLKNLDFIEDIETISEFDFRKIPIYKRIPNSQIRFKNLVEWFFPNETIGFEKKEIKG